MNQRGNEASRPSPRSIRSPGVFEVPDVFPETATMPAERPHRLIRLHRVILSGVALTCLTLTLSVGSRPARADDNQTCSDSNASAAAVIAACSQVILNSRSGGKNIAW